MQSLYFVEIISFISDEQIFKYFFLVYQCRMSPQNYFKSSKIQITGFFLYIQIFFDHEKLVTGIPNDSSIKSVVFDNVGGTHSLLCDCNSVLFPFPLTLKLPLFPGLLPRELFRSAGLFPREPRPFLLLPFFPFSRDGLWPRVGDGFFTSTIRQPKHNLRY